MRTRRAIVLGGIAAFTGAVFFGGGYATGSYRSALSFAWRRLAQRSQIIQSPFGKIEYAVAGRGSPLMMVHGTGGGFDQGLRFGQKLATRGFQIVAPSRFGYLGSDLPNAPSPDRQADAFVRLLDHLEIDRIAVAGGSAGALPAAEFAIRHPNRCSHLILLAPAVNINKKDPVEFTAAQRVVVRKVLTSDFWFWAFRTLAPNLMLRTLLATDPALLGSISEQERERAAIVMDELMPISMRARGIANDGRFSGQPTKTDFAQIAVPTLLVSCADDLFGTANSARTLSSLIRSSKLIVYPNGGHIWLGHDTEIAEEIRSFVSNLR